MSLREIEPIQPTVSPGLSLRARVAVGVFALVAGLVAFYPVLRAWFSSEELVLFNAIRQDLFSVWFGADRKPGFFRPVIPLLAYAWESLFGLRPFAFHALSVGLHAVNSVLVYYVARHWVKFLRPDERLRMPTVALICGAWFWIWPSHSEPVGWIPGLTDVAAATGLLASLAAYLRYRNRGKTAWFILALVAYLVALCTKEAAITLPGVIIIYELMRAQDARRMTRRNWVGPGAFLFIMAIYFLFRRWLMGAFLGGYGGSLHENFSWENLRLALAPNLANAFAPVPQLTLQQKSIMIALAAMLMLGILWRARRHLLAIAPVIAMVASALVLFLPGINLGPGLIIEGQRFAYIPSALAVISVVFTLALAVRKTRWFAAAGCLGIIAGATLLGNYNMSWLAAGKAARQIVRGMKDLPPARKLFVLATTDSTREAFIMPHSLGAVASLMLDQPPAQQMPMAVSVNYWHPNMTVEVTRTEREGEPGWLVHLNVPDDDTANSRLPETAPRLDVLNFMPGDWAEITPLRPRAIFVRPNDYDPALDRIVYLNGTRWQVL